MKKISTIIIFFIILTWCSINTENSIDIQYWLSWFVSYTWSSDFYVLETEQDTKISSFIYDNRLIEYAWLPWEKYLKDNWYDKIFDYKNSWEIEELEKLIQKNKEFCKKKLNERNISDELRDCLLFWLLTEPEDESIPYFFYRETQKKNDESWSLDSLIREKNWIFGNEANDIVLDDVLVEEPNKRFFLKFWNIKVSWDIISEEYYENNKLFTKYYIKKINWFQKVYLGSIWTQSNNISTLYQPSIVNQRINPKNRYSEYCMQWDNYLLYECGRHQTKYYDIGKLRQYNSNFRISYLRFLNERDWTSDIFYLTWFNNIYK